MHSVQDAGSAASPWIQLLVLLAMLDGATSHLMDATRVTANASAHVQRVSGVAGVRTAPRPDSCPRRFDSQCRGLLKPLCEPAWQLRVLGRMPFLRVCFLWESPFWSGKKHFAWQTGGKWRTHRCAWSKPGARLCALGKTCASSALGMLQQTALMVRMHGRLILRRTL